MKNCSCDYPTSEVFRKYFLELQGKYAPLTTTVVNSNDTSEDYFQRPETIAILQQMGLVGKA